MNRASIRRDQAGVPHIEGKDWPQVFRGLGYCHARDRGLQMLTMRTLGRGRASELLAGSDENLAIDLFFRRMNWAGGAEQEAARFAPEVAPLVAAYCQGANQRFAESLPFELRLLGYRHDPWTPADAVVLSRMGGYLTLTQSQAETERLLVEMVQAGVARELLEEFFPGHLDGLDIELLRRVRLGAALVPAAVKWNTALPRLMASNNWVLAGSRTASGKPMLSNDPHLAVTLPNVWCEVVLKTPDRYGIGATMPGVPALSVGRTNDVAWGATYAFMDNVDSWIEDCRDGCYRRATSAGDTWSPFRARHETVLRRGKAPHEVVFHENEHGTLDGDPNAAGLYLATRWSGIDTAAASLSAMHGVLCAPDVDAAMRAAGGFGQLAANWVLADRHGNIGYQMSGLLPRRRRGASGLVPLPGWNSENDWQGFVDADDLPRCLNPSDGLFVTANQDLNAWGRTKPSNLPMGDYRARRIEILLKSRERHDLRSVQDLCYDVFSIQAETFMTLMRPLLPATAAGRALGDWDLRYDPDSRGAYLFEQVYRALMREVFGTVLGPALDFLVAETGTFIDFYANADAILLAETSAWFGTRTREQIYRSALAAGLSGPLHRWGDVNRVTFRNLLLGGRLPRWVGFDRGPYEIRGGRATVHQGQIYRLGARDTNFVPSLRLCTDMAGDEMWSNMCGGPCDRRFSRFYNSETAAWAAGRFKRLKA
ncbi:MAG: penicillin acylase family protein [Deltaproteobacteria bacterium]|nr:penicillin acylase family protein [Deltaproteobacteria bacterium]